MPCTVPLAVRIYGSERQRKEGGYNCKDSKKIIGVFDNFMVENLRKQIALGVAAGVYFCMGAGKNEVFLRVQNHKVHFFARLSRRSICDL